MEFSEEQSTIVTSSSRRIVVLAGPGTGKTSKGIMGRISRYLNDNEDPRRIRLLSFTRAAATDLREKLMYLGIPGASDISASTIHSMCAEMLRSQSVFRSMNRVDRFLLNHEVLQMLYDLELEMPNIHQRKKALRDFESGWITDPESYEEVGLTEEAGNFSRQLRQWLMLHDSMLLGELIPIAYNYLRANPYAPLFDSIDHLVVDEYQDLNELEQRVIAIISDQAKSTLIVGDDDQSIYSFKHAFPEGIRGQAAADDTELIELNTSYRVPLVVAEAANRLMRWETATEESPVVPIPEHRGYMAVVQWRDPADEIEGIAAAVTTAGKIRGVEFGDILVLVPNRHIGRSMAERLRSLEVPVKSYFDQAYLDGNLKAQEVLALFQLKKFKEDPLAWRILFGLGKQRDTSVKYRSLMAEASLLNEKPYTFLSKRMNVIAVRKKYRQFMTTLALYQPTVLAIQNLTTEETIERLLPEAEPSLKEFRRVALERRAAFPKEEFGAFEVGVRTDLSSDEVPTGTSFVRVMSLHKSKGLSAPHVFVTSLVEGLIPNYSDVETAEERHRNQQEARRLLYVAMTRSSEELVLSYFASTKTIGDAKRLGITNTPHVNPRGTVPLQPNQLLVEVLDESLRAQRGPIWLRSYEAMGLPEYFQVQEEKEA